MTIKYIIKNVYGVDRMYPIDRKISQALIAITGATTITKQTMQGLEQLGLKFKQVLSPIDKDVLIS